MNFKKFWHRLVAVMTLTVCLVTLQLPLFSNQVWAATQCTEKGVMSKVDCSDNSTTNNTINGSPTFQQNNTYNTYNNNSGGHEAEAFVGGTMFGAIGTALTLLNAGHVAEIGTAAITSAAAIGHMVGGGIVAGSAVSAAAPVVAVAGVGYLGYKAWQWFHPDKSQETAQ